MRFAWPVEGRILSGFGPKAGGRYNDGVNIKATAGAPVRAAADGVVAYAGDALEGFGGLVLLKHGDGWVTAYAHNEELLVARGQTVKRGDIVARAGSTGSVDEPQLHFEIRRGRTPVDPLRHLPPRGALN
jgi:murein DD-endopeptidase MepM/ murein hydrolase activator NlpD